MDLKEAEIFFCRAIEENVALIGNLTLLKKVISSWLETIFREAVSIPVFFKWLKRLFFNCEKIKSDENSCILVVVILEKLLEDDHINSINFSNNLFLDIILPLQNIIIRHYFSKTEYSDISIEILLSFYRIHLKLSQNAQHACQVKKYGLWKAVMNFYLQNDKFNLFIQNICTEYLNNLLATEFMPDELLLLLDITTSNAALIKTNVETNGCNDQFLFRSLRLLNHILLKNIPKLNKDAFNLISRRCHLLSNYSSTIACVSKTAPIIKYALRVHLLLKYIVLAGDECVDPELRFEILIHSSCGTLLDSKFFKYIPEMFNLFEEIFSCSRVRNVWIQAQIIAFDVYLQRLSFSTDLPPFNSAVTSGKILDFIEKYRAQLSKSPDLSELVDSSFKLLSDSNCLLTEDVLNYFIRLMNCLLKNFVGYDGWLSCDLCNLLINVVHSAGSLLSKCEIICNDIHDILETIISVCKLEFQNRLDIKLAAYCLCRVILKQRIELSPTDLQCLKQMILDGFQNERWEVRDSVLELLMDLTAKIPDYAENDAIINDQQFFEIFCQTLYDEESYVRSSAYEVLSKITSLAIRFPIINYEFLLSQTVTRFSQETEGNVRVAMIHFIQSIWENCKIKNFSLLMSIYNTMYQASSMDLYDDVRLSGMHFWLQLVRCFMSKSEVETDNAELDDLLAHTGCFQALMNAFEDEYDLRVTKIAVTIAECLLSTDSLFGNFDRVEGYQFLSSVSDTIYSDDLNGIVALKHLLDSTPSANLSHSFVSRKDFLSKYSKSELKQIINDKFCLSEELGLENLLHSFQKITFDLDVNEKDCY